LVFLGAARLAVVFLVTVFLVVFFGVFFSDLGLDSFFSFLGLVSFFSFFSVTLGGDSFLASLMVPLGPFGKAKTPFSTPLWMAIRMRLAVVVLSGSLKVFRMYFLIACRLLPLRSLRDRIASA
jgi:hypothetical protein